MDKNVLYLSRWESPSWFGDAGGVSQDGKEETFMHRVFGLAKGMVRKSLERDRSSERYVEAVSRSLWPWRESWLLGLVSLVAVLDYVSTYAVLELSGNTHVYEGGLLASLGPYAWVGLPACSWSMW